MTPTVDTPTGIAMAFVLVGGGEEALGRALAVGVVGLEVRDGALESLGAFVGMVRQEPSLFSGTIDENIRYNTASASRADVIAAAKAVSAHDFIMRLPDGYDSQLGQRGRNLSVG